MHGVARERTVRRGYGYLMLSAHHAPAEVVGGPGRSNDAGRDDLVLLRAAARIPFDMPYTLYHVGVLIGETDFEGDGNPRNPRHLAGIFRPTSYGRRIMPQLSGILTAGADLKDELIERGLSEEGMSSGDVTDLLETSAAGRRVIDIGRTLSEVELRDPQGKTLEFTSIGFMDMAELARLTRRLECEPDVDLEALPEGAPEFIVSATLRAETSPSD
jgi:hypothetical protein